MEVEDTGRVSPPLVTVVIPAYNAVRWINRAIDSVLRQTLSHWEIVVIDDGSKDDTSSVVRRYDDSRIRLIVQDQAGPAAARNRGIEIANGTYIAFLDSDDEYAPTFLERTTTFLNNEPKCVACTTNVYWADRTGRVTVRYSSGAIIDKIEGIVTDLLRTRMRDRSFPQIYLVIRAAELKAVGGFNSELHAGEEEELLLRLLPRGEFGYIDEPLVYYHDTPDSFIKDLSRTTHAKAILWRHVIPHDRELRRQLPSYRKFRDLRMFRAAIISVAAGCLDDAKEIASLWPSSPSSIHWWLGYGLVWLPRPVLRALHLSVGWTNAVRHRNERG